MDTGMLSSLSWLHRKHKELLSIGAISVNYYLMTNDRRRNKVAKILGKFGTRVNYSVFECMVTDKEFEKLRTDIEKKIDVREDRIAYYPICLKCYTKIKYRLPHERVHEKVTVV